MIAFPVDAIYIIQPLGINIPTYSGTCVMYVELYTTLFIHQEKQNGSG